MSEHCDFHTVSICYYCKRSYCVQDLCSFVNIDVDGLIITYDIQLFIDQQLNIEMCQECRFANVASSDDHYCLECYFMAYVYKCPHYNDD